MSYICTNSRLASHATLKKLSTKNKLQQSLDSSENAISLTNSRLTNINIIL